MSTDPGAESELATPALAAALVAFQGEIETVSKGKTAVGSKFSYTYADLGDCFDTIRKPLAKHGLAIVQRPSVRASETGAQELELETILVHSSGASISSTLAFPIPGVDLQGLGSAITYLRRYSLLSILGIAASDDDDDGKGALPAAKSSKGGKAPKSSKAKKPAASSSKASANQLKLVWARARERAREFVAEGDTEAEKQLAEEILRGALPPDLESSKDLAGRDVDSVLERISTFDIGAGTSAEPKAGGDSGAGYGQSEG